jgi:hypothetical protein
MYMVLAEINKSKRGKSSISNLLEGRVGLALSKTILKGGNPRTTPPKFI